MNELRKRAFNRLDNLASPPKRKNREEPRQTAHESLATPVNHEVIDLTSDDEPQTTDVQTNHQAQFEVPQPGLNIQHIFSLFNNLISPSEQQESAKVPKCRRKNQGNNAANATDAFLDKIEEIECDNPGPLDETQDEYEVEKIITSHKNKYLLKWRGWKLSDSSWERQDSLSCPVIINAFKFRVRLAEKIKEKCKQEERSHFPYNTPQTRITWLLRFHAWEDALNKACREAMVAPIYVENWHDDEVAPPNFVFGQQNIFHKSAKSILKPLMPEIHCLCQGSSYCKRDSCCSSLIKSNFPYVNAKLSNERTKIVECSNGCQCDRNCPARLVQRGRQIPIVLFRTADRGWSVRAASYIPRTTFVMPYLGEVIDNEEASKREKVDGSFLFNVDCFNVDKQTYVVDALNYGNEARWVNHSCDPNLKVFGVLIDRFVDYETLAFFAMKDIQVGEELTIDYYAHVHEQLVEGVPCHCGSKNCRKFLMD